jgi:hypothetical protein
MRITIILVLIAISTTAFSQNNPYNLPPKNQYKHAIVRLKDATKFENVTIKIDSTCMSITNNKNYKKNTVVIPLSEIEYVRIKKGNNALAYTGLGALTGVVICLYNPELMVVFVPMGAVVGGVIGVCSPTRQTYYLEN